MAHVIVRDGAQNSLDDVAPHGYLNGFHDAVRRRAFSIFEERGRGHGRDTEDWLQAEREVLCFPETSIHSDGTRITLTAKVEGFHGKDLKVTAWPREIVIEGSAASPDGAEARMVFCRIATDPIDSAAVRASLSRGALKIDAPLVASGKTSSRPLRRNERAKAVSA